MYPKMMKVWKEECNKNEPLMGTDRLVLGKNLQGYIVALGSNAGTVVDKVSVHEISHCEYAKDIDMNSYEYTYRPKTENFMPDALKDGEKIIFICEMNKHSENVKGYGRYARPHERWNTHIVNINELEGFNE